MWNGFTKYLALQLQSPLLKDSEKEDIQQQIKLINSNLDKKEIEIMKVFECNPEWPICLYDYTFKNQIN